MAGQSVEHSFVMIDVDTLREQLLRARRRTMAALIIEAVVTAAGMVVGAGCAYIAWQWHDLFFAVAALVLLLVCPAGAVAFYRLRRRSLEWSDRTSEGTLRYALMRLRLASSMLRVQCVGGGILLLLVALVWVGVLAGQVSRFYPLRTISVLWTSAAIATILWSMWRLRRNQQEYVSCERQLALEKPSS